MQKHNVVPWPQLYCRRWPGPLWGSAGREKSQGLVCGHMDSTVVRGSCIQHIHTRFQPIVYSIMADTNLYRASTFAPVNIAVIKCVPAPAPLPPLPPPPPPAPFLPHHQLTLLLRLQVLGQEGCNTQPAHQLVPLRHPLARRPPHTHDRLVQPVLCRRHVDPQWLVPRHQRRPNTSLSP